ncbi:hypothetical protein STENM36S_02809 [Streptomyces tendae]
MSPDVDLTAATPGPHPVRNGFLRLDQRAFEAVAARTWPGADPLLPRLSRSANHGVLWFAAAAALAASRTPRARRAAARTPRSGWPRWRSTPSASARCAGPARYWTRCRWSGS